MNIQKLFLTFFGAGLSPKSPEIVGTLAAMAAGVLLLYTMGMETLFMLILAVTTIGIFEINKQEKPYSDTIVIDDVAGVWLALLIPHTAALSLSYPYVQEIAVIFSFVTFRLFDTWKPSTIGWIRHNVNGGLGVMGSAVLSGFAGGFLTIIMLLGIDRLY